MIRLGTPAISSEDVKEVARVLESGLLVQGAEVEGFESDLRSLLGIRNVVVMSNCTSALEVALRALGVGPGDIVITSSYSWIATANVVELCGATPRFVDIDPSTYNLDIGSLERVVANLEREDKLKSVRAIMPVHAFGYVVDMDELVRVGSRLDAPIVEDAACALGALFEGRPAGTIGNVGCFSFHPRKSITSGEGGALVTNDDVIAEAARAYRNHGQKPGIAHSFETIGHNFRLTEPMAALARSQLARLDDLLAQRRLIIETYLAELAGCVDLPQYIRQRHAAQAFVVMLPPGSDRERVRASLTSAGVETGAGTIAIPLTAAYSKKYHYDRAEFPGLREVAARALALPLHAGLTREDAEYVVKSLIETLE